MEFDSNETRRSLDVNGRRYDYFSLAAAEVMGLAGIARLPYTLKIVLENLMRQQVRKTASSEDIVALVNWLQKRGSGCAIGFRPARVLMPDSTGVPLLGDMAAMRDAMVRLNADPNHINPIIPVDFIVDHAIMVDQFGSAEALAHNMAREYAQNKERYEFLRWGSNAFDNLRLFPPGTGICHQINLEYLAKVVWSCPDQDRILAYPDSVIGTDSHTAMINALGIIGWGVGGLDGCAVALGEPICMLIPEVVGCCLSGKLRAGVTSTDLVLTITQVMRSHKLIGKFIEYVGSGVDELTLYDRATIAAMTPECGSTMGFFAVDEETLHFLETTGRDARQVALVAAYAKAQGIWRDATTPLPDYSQVIEIDLSTIEPCVSGPGRPHGRVPLADAPNAFHAAYPVKGNAVSVEDAGFTLGDGDVVIAAITSCTNTSNPSVMIGAGLLARNAIRRGLRSKPWVKTSLSPGSRVVADYLEQSGLQRSLDQLGFHLTGFGCMTCMGNSGPLAEPIEQAIENENLTVVAVLSGNRNFDARIHSSVRANFLASPPLVVAYALAGSISKDLTHEPLGTDDQGVPVYLHDIWPDGDEIQKIIAQTLSPQLFRNRYENVLQGSTQWQQLESSGGSIYPWNPQSTFIRRPPFFEDMTIAPPAIKDIRGARVLAIFGDMLTTDHISPIGSIPAKTPAGQYLRSLGIAPKDFVTYAARRLNHDVMIRGAFANIRIRNEMTPGVEGSSTKHMPDGQQMSFFDAAERYRKAGVPLVIVGGMEYGAGSSRDWAAKGTALLGVSAVIAESFERIHRSNLVGMGVLPLQFTNGVTRKSLRLHGSEIFDIQGLQDHLTLGRLLPCTITRATGEREMITLLVRLDTQPEVDYYRHGGILKYVLRHRITPGGIK